MNVENMHLYYDPHISFYIINIRTGYYKYYLSLLAQFFISIAMRWENNTLFQWSS